MTDSIPIEQIYDSPILIVDDNEINRIFLERTLRSQGFTKLLAVDSGEKALQILPGFQPEIVLLDIVMPGGMDGFECCKTIRKQKKFHDLPILIQTAITEPELRVKAFECGATDFVSKPIYPDELYARILVHLEKMHSLKALQFYKKRMVQELDTAIQLQQAILPSMEEIERIERKCHLDIVAYFQPSSEIGGDFWGINDLFPNQTALWLVDFSGHGVAAALNAFRLQAYMREHSPLVSRPGEYLSYLNDKLLRLLTRGHFATMFYGIVDTQSNQILYSCACTPHPIILRGATGKAETIDGSESLMGTGIHLYQTKITPFIPGDRILLYSDALIETPNAKGEFITEEQLMQIMEEHKGASSAAIKEIILDYFNVHSGESLADDLTLVICGRPTF